VEKEREIDPAFPEIDFVSRKDRSWYERSVDVLRGRPLILSRARSLEMQLRVAEILSKGPEYDGIILYELAALQYCPPDALGRVVLNIEDPQAIKYRRMSRIPTLSLARRARCLISSLMARHYESTMLSRLGAVVALSESDVRDMRDTMGLRNVSCVPYGVRQPPNRDIAALGECTDGIIVFSGNMHHPPNVDGGLHFLREIFPRVLKHYPSATVWIVGADPDARLQTAAARLGTNVVVTGKVDDISTFIRRAKVSICPIRLKIGVQTKVLEALSWGTPTVVTSAGNSGIGGLSGETLWVADDAVEFADRVVSLLQGQEWTAMSDKGRAFVAAHFSWERSAEILEQCVYGIRSER
jgi:glycosyltransferase involved in cell wall biosynthesis